MKKYSKSEDIHHNLPKTRNGLIQMIYMDKSTDQKRVNVIFSALPGTHHICHQQSLVGWERDLPYSYPEKIPQRIKLYTDSW